MNYFRKFIGLGLAGLLSCAAPQIRREIETYKLFERIGVNPDVYKVDEAKFDSNSLYFGNSEAQFRDKGNTVYLWHSDPKTNDLLGMTKIYDLDGDGLVDLVKIERHKEDHTTLVYRIFNLQGPESAVLNYYVVKSFDVQASDYEMDKVILVAPDEAAIAPFQRIFDRMRSAD